MNPHPAPIILDVSGFDLCVAYRRYEGDTADLVRALKYGRSTSVVSELAEAIASVAPVTSIVSWIPATPKRLRRRGFDQSELLARAVARRVGGRAIRLLRRTDDTAQTSRDIAGRLMGPTLVYAGRRRHTGSDVLVIDDVCTTGSTLAAAAATLRAGGHPRVLGAVVAKVVTQDATHGARCRSNM